MHFSTIIAALAAVTPLVGAVGNARVRNQCKDPVYLYSVGSSVGPQVKLSKGQMYSEAFRHDPVSGGISIKVVRTIDGLYDGSPQTNFAYALDGNNIWYDLSDIFGDAFSGSKLVVRPAVTTCPSITWATGVPPAGSQVHVCNASSNVTLTLCAA